MLIDALDHGEEDLEQRRLAENRVEARRILAATARPRSSTTPTSSSRASKTRIEQACAALEEAARGDAASLIHARIEALDDATKAFAGRRMNRAIARAIEGRRVDVVEKSVEHAKGVEEAHVR